MADKFKALAPDHIEFIERQHLFFVGTAGSEGRVNVSPKGLDTLRVVDESQVIWLNLTGSGNETSAHVQESGRMTLMFCSFEKRPLILRLYGQAVVVHSRDSEWQDLSPLFGEIAGARQIFKLKVDLVQTSCGFAVPFYDFVGEREALLRWAENRGRDGLAEYWQEHNQVSLDRKPTHIL